MKGNFKREGEFTYRRRITDGALNRQVSERSVPVFRVEDLDEFYSHYPKMKLNPTMLDKLFESNGYVLVYDFFRPNKDYVNFISF